MSAAAGPPRRVVVAIGPTATDPLALAAAARLARTVGAALTTLFVEDVGLLRLAQSPYAYEICAASGTARRFAAADVEHAFKNEADTLRRMLTEVAAAFELQLEFAVVRGRPTSALLRASDQEDFVVLASSGVRTFTRASAPSLVRAALGRPARAQSGTNPPVAALIDSADAGARVLAAAHQLAKATSADLIVFLPESAATDTGRRAIDDWLMQTGAAARVIYAPDAGIAQSIRNERVSALFWTPPADQEMIATAEELVSAIACPLVVLR